MIVRFWRILFAVVAGSLIYFALERFLPPPVQHHPYQIDLGLAVAFCLCLACYGILRLIR